MRTRSPLWLFCLLVSPFSPPTMELLAQSAGSQSAQSQSGSYQSSQFQSAAAQSAETQAATFRPGEDSAPAAAAVPESRFTPLFDGHSFEGWEHPGNWEIEDGVFHRARSGGQLTYTAAKVPDDFELRFDWKASKGCNSGVYYRPGQVEYQVLDNVHSPYGENPRQAAASLFFCMAPNQDVCKPHNTWNTARIVCKGSVIQHWLNEEKVIDFDYTDPRWAEEVNLLRIRGGNLAGRGGKLWLQDHGDEVWFRNLRWREIPAEEALLPDPNFRPLPIPPAALEKEAARVRSLLKQQSKAATPQDN